MYSRAERITDLAQANTSAEVGPGSYRPTDGPQPLPGYAPFGSTADRVTVDVRGRDVKAPGPWTYEASDVTTTRKGGSTAFKSRVPRFEAHASKATVAVPGPTTYTVPSAAANSARGPRLRDPADTWRPRAARVLPASSNPPSIPDVHSHGYDMDENGRLVKQPPPAPGAEEPRKRPKSVAKGSRVRAPNFAKRGARVTYFDAISRTGAQTPGPGTYSLPPKGPSQYRGRKANSFYFASSTPMAWQTEEAAEGPGPQTYSPAHVAWTTAPVAADRQCFGSSQRRLGAALLGAAGQAMHHPGPGQYEERRSALNVAKAVTAAPFSQTAARFTTPAVTTPGPAAYEATKVLGFGRELLSRPTTTKPSFGSRAERSARLGAAQDVDPGPGSYDVPAPTTGFAARGAFVSGSERFSSAAASTRRGALRTGLAAGPHADDQNPPPTSSPPPTAYKVPSRAAPPTSPRACNAFTRPPSSIPQPLSGNLWDEPRVGHRHRKPKAHLFGSSAHQPILTASESPGPTTYNPRLLDDFRKQRTTYGQEGGGFLSKVRRGMVGSGGEGFSHPEGRPPTSGPQATRALDMSGANATPGPGAYTPEVPPLVKKSFNVTLGAVSVQ